MTIEAGSVIAGRYRLDHVLGEGGMGAVWAATHTLTHKRVAIKLLKADIASPDTLRRFVREARAASAVRHPNVVEVHDILTLDDGSPAMVMDFLEGETLARCLERRGPLRLPDLVAIMVPVLSAVASAHAAGIIHRDLKPDNIFLARLGDGRTEPMVLDFGIAKVLPFAEQMGNESALTQSGAMLGTPYYMAPEQAFGEKDLDARVDVWALGVILYECASGKKPITGETLGQVFKAITTGKTVPLPELVPELPGEFVSLVESMMQRDRSLRAADLREPFDCLRRLGGSVVAGFGAAMSVPPPRVSLPFEATERAPSRPTATSEPAPSAAVGLGASAVPVTKGVGLPRRRPLTPVVLGAGVVALGGLIALGASLGRRDEPSAAGAPDASMAPAAPLMASAATATTAPSAAPEPVASATSAVSPPRPAKVSSPGKRKAASVAEPSAASASPAPASTVPPRRRLLPGGVDDSPPF